MKITHRGGMKTAISYDRVFDYRGHCNYGFAFPCDEHGHVSRADLTPGAWDNYDRCLGDAELDVVDRGVRRVEQTYHEPSIGLCNHCGAEVELGRFTCECECGALYNWAGQELAPREQWGEETGEHWSDIERGVSEEDW